MDAEFFKIISNRCNKPMAMDKDDERLTPAYLFRDSRKKRISLGVGEYSFVGRRSKKFSIIKLTIGCGEPKNKRFKLLGFAKILGSINPIYRIRGLIGSINMIANELGRKDGYIVDLISKTDGFPSKSSITQ